jgi:hypothetical protein
VLGNNKLTRVPHVIAHLTALESLDLGDNMAVPEEEADAGVHYRPIVPVITCYNVGCLCGGQC